MINNIILIKPLLQFQSEDDFYHLQIIKRKKEHPELSSNSHVVKTYYIRSQEYLEKKFAEIQSLCNFHNARAYINLNVRSFERTAFHTLKKVTDQIMNRDFKSVRKAYESVCGEFGAGRDKRWIIDIDFDSEYDGMVAAKLPNFLNGLAPIGEVKLISIIPTKDGYHLITKPFNVQEYSAVYKFAVHKNNPTILYVP